MKTINVNLIGNLGKASKTSYEEAKKKNRLDSKSQIFAWILIVVTLITFSVGFGGWFAVRQMTLRLNNKLNELESNLAKLNSHSDELTIFRKNLKRDKEIAELKITVQKQINDSFFPWSDILKEIAAKIPKNIIVQKIEKYGNTKDSSFNLKITGIIPGNKKNKPLMTISLFIFSLNNNANSLLSDAKISRLEFNDKTQAYEFELETSMMKKNGVKENE